MALTRTMVCVGGKYDGKRYEAKGTHFVVPIVQPFSVLADVQDGMPAAQAASVIDSEYQEMVWHCPAGSVSFWVEKGIPELAAMEKLLNHYIQR